MHNFENFEIKLGGLDDMMTYTIWYWIVWKKSMTAQLNFSKYEWTLVD